MARRRREGLVDAVADVLAIGPVWLGPALAVAVFVLGWLILPSVLDDPSEKMPVGRVLGPTIKHLSPFLAGFVLLIWLVARIKRFSNRRLFDSHQERESLRHLSWRQFEGYVGEAFRRQGYAVEETGDPAGDGGVDLILRKDGQTALVQCKHWKAYKVGVQPVRELLGVVSSEGAHAGILVTSGRFTSEAWEFARANHLRLIDGDALGNLVESIRMPEKDPSPGELSSRVPRPVADQPIPPPSPPSCPRCGQPMVMRTARRGAGAGDQFWGCRAYPGCKGTRPA